MAYRLASERLALELDEGLTVEVERIAALAVQYQAQALAGAVMSAQTRAVQVVALRDLYGFFVDEAQPTWALLDHRGPIQASAGGMLRLSLPLGLAIVEGWIGSFVAATAEEAPEQPASAVDAVLEPGPFRDAVVTELHGRRRAA